MAPLFAALFAAWFGASVALAAESRHRRITQFNETASASSLAATMCGNALSFKEQCINKLFDEFSRDRTQFLEAIAAQSSQINSNFNLNNIPTPRFSIDEFDTRCLQIEGLNSRTIAQIEALKSAVSGLMAFLEERNALIAEYREANGRWSREDEAYWYFGVDREGIGKDSRFFDNLKNLRATLDAIIFHSFCLHKEMFHMALIKRERLPRSARRSAGLAPGNFKRQRSLGNFPDSEQYKDWLDPLDHQRVGKWWWTKRMRVREVLRRAEFDTE